MNKIDHIAEEERTGCFVTPCVLLFLPRGAVDCVRQSVMVRLIYVLVLISHLGAFVQRYAARTGRLKFGLNLRATDCVDVKAYLSLHYSSI